MGIAHLETVHRKVFQVATGQGFGEAWSDIESDAYGWLNYLNFSKSCREIYSKCPFRRQY
jgi:hypothetical protein